jgi:carbon monoxide dehydrogenase subunit G
MKINLNGEFEASAQPKETFDFISTPARFCPVLPYFKDLKCVGEQNFTVVLEVGVPQIRGLVEVNTVLVEQRPPEHVVYSARGSHPLGMMDSLLNFDVVPMGSGSIVRWRTETMVSGTLVSLANGILLPLAKRQIKTLVASVRSSLEGDKESASPKSQTAQSQRSSSLRGLFQPATGTGAKPA